MAAHTERMITLEIPEKGQRFGTRQERSPFTFHIQIFKKGLFSFFFFYRNTLEGQEGTAATVQSERASLPWTQARFWSLHTDYEWQISRLTFHSTEEGKKD